MSPASSAWALYLLLLGSCHSWGCCCHISSCLHRPWLQGLPLLGVALLWSASSSSAPGWQSGLQLSSSTANRCWQSPNTSTLAAACMATHKTWKGNGCSPARQAVHTQMPASSHATAWLRGDMLWPAAATPPSAKYKTMHRRNTPSCIFSTMHFVSPSGRCGMPSSCWGCWLAGRAGSSWVMAGTAAVSILQAWCVSLKARMVNGL